MYTTTDIVEIARGKNNNEIPGGVVQRCALAHVISIDGKIPISLFLRGDNCIGDALWILSEAMPVGMEEISLHVCSTFAAGCVERIAYLYEQLVPGDMSIRKMIDACSSQTGQRDAVMTALADLALCNARLECLSYENSKRRELAKRALGCARLLAHVTLHPFPQVLDCLLEDCCKNTPGQAAFNIALEVLMLVEDVAEHRFLKKQCNDHIPVCVVGLHYKYELEFVLTKAIRDAAFRQAVEGMSQMMLTVIKSVSGTGGFDENCS